MIISCDKLHQKPQEEDFYKAKCPQNTSPLLMNLQFWLLAYNGYWFSTIENQLPFIHIFWLNKQPKVFSLFNQMFCKVITGRKQTQAVNLNTMVNNPPSPFQK